MRRSRSSAQSRAPGPTKSAPPQEQRAARLPIRTILYPTDFSDRSEAALSVARSFARTRAPA